MADLITFSTFQKFLDHNQKDLLDKYFVYYHFLQSLPKLEKKEYDLFEAYNVIDSDGNSAMCVWMTGNYFIYSHKWTEEIVDFLVNKIEIQKFKNFNFLGQRNLILQLFDKSNIKYNLIKDRLIYECERVVVPKISKIGEVQNATYQEFDELVQMSMDNYVEEYNGKGQKSIKEMEASVILGIEKKSLFILKNNGTICSIVQVINDNENDPMLGNLFTKKDERNKGFAYSLLHTVTEGLLQNGYEKCGLVSDVMNPASNKVFINIGYKPTYEWIILSKEN